MLGAAHQVCMLLLFEGLTWLRIAAFWQLTITTMSCNSLKLFLRSTILSTYARSDSYVPIIRANLNLYVVSQGLTKSPVHKVFEEGRRGCASFWLVRASLQWCWVTLTSSTALHDKVCSKGLVSIPSVATIRHREFTKSVYRSSVRQFRHIDEQCVLKKRIWCKHFHL